MTEAKDPALLVAEHELHLARKRIEQQQQTIEALARNLKRTASARTATIAPATDEARRAPPTPDAMPLAPGDGWPSLPMPKTPLPPPPGLGAQSLAGGKTKVVAFAVFGLEGEALEAAVRSVADRQRQAMDFVPVFLTDSPVHDVFRRRGYAFEYFQRRRPKTTDYPLDARIATALRKWRAMSLVDMLGAMTPDAQVASHPTSVGAIRDEKESRTILPFRRFSKPRSKAAALERKLWAGFSRPALREIERLKRTSSKSDRVDAAWALAKWFAAHGDYRRSLDQIALLHAIDAAHSQTKQVALLEAEALVQVGQEREARQRIASAQSRLVGFDADLCLAFANTLATDPEPDASIHRLGWINRVFLEEGLAPIALRNPDSPIGVDNISVPEATKVAIEHAPTVSVIIPAFNAADTIRVALDSLLAQTWPSVEIIVVDDCSSDPTFEVALEYASRSTNVVALRHKQNRGAYAARNTGLNKATGDFITTHDADDWSHPQKLELLVRPMLMKGSLVGAKSFWARTSPNLYFPMRWEPGSFLIHQSYSSFVFTRRVVEALGGWDDVRVSADAEFIARAETVFGKASIFTFKNTVPLAFGLASARSLTGASETHLRTTLYGIRRDYEEAAARWRVNTPLEALRIDRSSTQRPFPAPARLLPTRASGQRSYDFVFIFDFSLSMPGGSFTSMHNYIRQCLTEEKKVGVFLWRRFDLAEQPLNDKVARLIDNFEIDLISPGDNIRADVVVVGQPQVVQFQIDDPPHIEFEHLVVVVNQTAFRMRGNVDRAYNPRRIVAVLEETFGTSGTWIPISNAVRRTMEDSADYPRPHEINWPPLLDLEMFEGMSPRWRGRTRRNPIVGRHGRDHYAKWPTEKRSLLDAYCAERGCNVRILGGADHALKVCGTLPSNWTVFDFNALPVRDFLEDLDFFVHFPNENLIEAFGMAVAEAMASGVPAILPPTFEETFGAAAAYAEPSEVWRTISSLWRDQEAYLKLANAGHQFARNLAGHCFERQVESLKSRPTAIETRRRLPAIVAPSAKDMGGQRVDLSDRVVFAIPLMPKTPSLDWAAVESHLARTLDSILASKDSRVFAVVAGHERPSLDLPKNVAFLEASFDPPHNFAAEAKDKYQKRLLIGAWLRSRVDTTCTVMFLDADDLVSTELSSYLHSTSTHSAFSIKRGFVFDSQTSSLYETTAFDQMCGSSFVCRFSPDELPASWRDRTAPFSMYKRHAQFADVAASQGRTVAEIPFEAAVYMTNHSESMQTRKLSRARRFRLSRPIGAREAMRILKTDFNFVQ
jgi:glycosyltransferase involved in cell wall biosynthesis